MKKFVFNKYFKYVSSLSEWSSSLYVFNKRNLFLLNNNEKEAYKLLYHYFSSNLFYNKITPNIKILNLKNIYNNNFSKFILKKFYFFFNLLNFLNIENKIFTSFSNYENSKGLIKKTWRLTRLLKYRLRRRFYIKLFKNRSVNKVYISKPKIKYSVKEVIITVYIYNRERFYFLKKLSMLNKIFFNVLERNETDKILLSEKLKKIDYPFKYIKNGVIPKLYNLNSFYNDINNNFNYYYNILNNFKNVPTNMFVLFKFNNNKYILNNIKKIFYKNLKKIFIYKFYISIIYLNNYKFNNNNMVELKHKLYKIYKKKISINIINLKYLYLENTIFLDGLMNKLNDRKKKVLRVIRKGLNLAKIVKLHPLFYRFRKVEKKNYGIEFNKLNNLLFNLKKNKYVNIISHLKNKHVSGLRIEAKGRLTRRLTASRAVYKLSYKGSLKNIYSSYNKLSTIMLRGLSKSNIEYINTNSKNRNGSYGVKYWLSTY
jgi:hypothetical protein